MLLHCNLQQQLPTPTISSDPNPHIFFLPTSSAIAAMEVEVVSGSKPLADAKLGRVDSQKDHLRVKRKTLQAVLEQCQRALESLGTTGGADEEDGGDDGEEGDDDNSSRGSAFDDERRQGRGSTSSRADCEADELRDLLKSRVECPDFLQKLESAQASVSQNIPAEEGNSWDLVSENDLWEDEDSNFGEEDYVLVRQEDIVEGIACFMAAYLLSLKQTKELTPNQLQEALSKTFSVKTKKGKLRKAWDGSKVIYNVASWGATAIGIYQNPVIIRVATKAFWTSCEVISKFL